MTVTRLEKQNLEGENHRIQVALKHRKRTQQDAKTLNQDDLWRKNNWSDLT